LEKHDSESNLSLKRLQEELKINLEAIEKLKQEGEKIDFIFLDGSILPQYIHKPREETKIREEYKATIELYKELYEKTLEAGINLVGAVEDSKGTRFLDLLAKEIEVPGGLTDSGVLNFLLRRGERTSFFRYADDFRQHPILKEFPEELGNNVFVFYMKASEFDRPLRLEFLSKNPKKEIEKIAEAGYFLSSHSKEYSYPSVLIEADLKARLKPNEVDYIYRQIRDRVPWWGIERRRECRLF
jgi:hypothetical protein